MTARGVRVTMADEAYRQRTEEVVGGLGVDPAHGLGADEVARRLQQYGRNELPAEQPTPAWRRLLAQFQDPLTILLLMATVVSFVAWVFERETPVPYEAIVILAIVLLNGGVIAQEGSPEDLYSRPKTLFTADFIGSNARLTGRVTEARDGFAVLDCDGLTVTGRMGHEVRRGDEATAICRLERLSLGSPGEPDCIEMDRATTMFLGEKWENVYRTGPHSLRVLTDGPVPERRLELFFTAGSAKKDVSLADLPDSHQICDCNGVSKGTICTAIKAGKCTIPAVGKATRAGTGCGSCKGLVKGLIEAVAGGVTARAPVALRIRPLAPGAWKLEADVLRSRALRRDGLKA